ncbi:arylamine N-acetyltransferase [Paenibacillus sp. P96]|uniref:Arylamine N-acetyltransferase n=1 Tax=Paenibacillus zeirhizosphaerae TaxID=2987519 RepID=A0ABT9FTZ4_9BACL|nr:arylamine N-acetyltransferase [Paenibacillus sp. P96]MDP4098212.1 arylamine N-acetyltransferase [Paenibacillus sp. P96]
MLQYEETKAYLKRLGIADIEPPTLAYLCKLHQAHVENMTWQTIDIVSGNPVPIDLRSSIQLMINGRSGYCFHLNGAFGELLRTLGYKVSWHRAGVQPLGQEPRINSFHLGLSVTLLNEQQEEEIWIADVGLGDMPYGPLPIRAGSYAQGPFQYQVTASVIDPNGWRMVHDPMGSSAGVDYERESLQRVDEFIPKHEIYSQSPESPWIHLFLVRNRHAEGSNELKGCIWKKREGDRIEKTEILTKSMWLEVLGDVFHEKLVNYSSLERDALWKRVWHLHEQWKREQTAAD